MVKLWTICTKLNFGDLLRYVIVCIIVLFFAAQPAIEIVLNLAEYELCENYEDDEVEEKEELKEQKKKPEFFSPKESTYISSTNASGHSIAENILFAKLSYIREFYLEIPIPPPEQI